MTKNFRLSAGVGTAILSGSLGLGVMMPPAALAYDASSAMERRIRQLEEDLRLMQSELSRVKSESARRPTTDTAVNQKVEDLEQRVDDVVSHQEQHHNLLFFRGGFAKMEHTRHDELLLNNSALGIESNPDGQGYYFGAGIDFRLSDDVWGLTDIAKVDGELMFEYKHFDSDVNALVSTYPVGTPLAGVAGSMKNDITQFTLSAAPKIKFDTGTPLTPWLIPAGLALHVISPPSSGVTVLDPGLMVGTGAEYRIWKDLVAGLDFRYHWTGNNLNYRSRSGLLNKTDIDGLTAGGYIGFGF
jgi:opacity protein-like surface antigen